jgi:predicted nucleic acid-binding protein
VVSVDAGIWLAFFRNEASARSLRGLLEKQRVSVHPFVLMELRLEVRGPQRARVLGDLERLVACAVDPTDVVSAFIEERDLKAAKIDVVGAHLLLSAVKHGDQLWSADHDLQATAVDLKAAFSPPDLRDRG